MVRQTGRRPKEGVSGKIKGPELYGEGLLAAIYIQFNTHKSAKLRQRQQHGHRDKTGTKLTSARATSCVSQTYGAALLE